MDIINQIVAQEKSVFIMLAEFAVFTVLISLIVYHLMIFIGRKSFPEGRLYLYFSGLFFGLLFYIFLDTCQFGILLSGVINVSAWNAFLISLSWLFILKSLMLILQFSLKPDEKSVRQQQIVFICFVAGSVLSAIPVFGVLNSHIYAVFLGLWFLLGLVIVFLLFSYVPLLLKQKPIDASSKIIGWTSLSYISYIWIYRLIISSTLITDQLPFWAINNFLKIAVAFTFAYALAIRFNKEFNDLAELKDNLEKKVDESTRELRLAKEKIEKASRLKTQYFINVAHETKTPLTLIGNYLDRYSKRVGVSPELKIVQENFELLRDAMILSLDVEKFEKGEVLYDETAVCDLTRTLELKIPLFTTEVQQKARTLKYEIEHGITVKADPLAVERIVHNLFDNALKFTNEFDEISVRLTSDGEMACFEIGDSGVGIKASDLPKIFDLYYQVAASKSNNPGFGTGLYIVKQTVDALHGTISVESEPGEGTRFTVKIPVYKYGQSSTRYSGAEVPAPERKSKVRFVSNDYFPERETLLLVEDNLDMLRYVRDELSTEYNVFTAIRGDEALAVLSTSPKPDLILSDVMMEGMDGFELYRRLSADVTFSSIPFIFITARSNNAEKIEMLMQGASDYIFKPFQIDELKAKVVSILKNTSVHRKAGLQDAINAIHSKFDEKKSPEPGKWELFAKRAREYELTDRQIEVVKLIDQGFEYKQIAETLNISQKTVHRHVQILFEKFDVHNKLELLRIFFG
jgi:signal transduction histidine kinase/DNA-binding NarL/FixJ family response regulator